MTHVQVVDIPRPKQGWSLIASESADQLSPSSRHLRTELQEEMDAKCGNCVGCFAGEECLQNKRVIRHDGKRLVSMAQRASVAVADVREGAKAAVVDAVKTAGYNSEAVKIIATSALQSVGKEVWEQAEEEAKEDAPPVQGGLAEVEEEQASPPAAPDATSRAESHEKVESRALKSIAQFSPSSKHSHTVSRSVPHTTSGVHLQPRRSGSLWAGMDKSMDRSSPNLRILHLSATVVKKVDARGVADLYCVIRRAADGVILAKTETIKGTLDPDWSPIELGAGTIGSDGQVRFEVYHAEEDHHSKADGIIGSCETDFNVGLAPTTVEKFSLWWRGKTHGTLMLQTEWRCEEPFGQNGDTQKEATPEGNADRGAPCGECVGCIEGLG